MDANWAIKWVPRAGGGKPKAAPDPSYPNGKSLATYDPEQPSCKGDLPYVLWPARGLGLLLIRCKRCGVTAAVTTAGRPDDPVTLQMNCKVGSA